MKFLKIKNFKKNNWQNRCIFALSGSVGGSGSGSSMTEKLKKQEEIAKLEEKKQRKEAFNKSLKGRVFLSEEVNNINKSHEDKSELPFYRRYNPLSSESLGEKETRLKIKRKKIKKSLFGNGTAANKGSGFFQHGLKKITKASQGTEAPVSLKQMVLKWKKIDDKSPDKLLKKDVLADLKNLSLEERKSLFAPIIGQSGERMFMLYGIKTLEELSFHEIFPEVKKIQSQNSSYELKDEDFISSDKKSKSLKLQTGSKFSLKEDSLLVQKEKSKFKSFSNQELFEHLNKVKEGNEEWLDSFSEDNHEKALDKNFSFKEKDKTATTKRILSLYKEDPQRFRRLFLKIDSSGVATVDFLGNKALIAYITLDMLLPQNIELIKINGEFAQRGVDENGSLGYIFTTGSRKGRKASINNHEKFETIVEKTLENFNHNAEKINIMQEEFLRESHFKKIGTKKGREQAKIESKKDEILIKNSLLASQEKEFKDLKNKIIKFANFRDEKSQSDFFGGVVVYDEKTIQSTLVSSFQAGRINPKDKSKFLKLCISFASASRNIVNLKNDLRLGHNESVQVKTLLHHMNSMNILAKEAGKKGKVTGTKEAWKTLDKLSTHENYIDHKKSFLKDHSDHQKELLRIEKKSEEDITKALKRMSMSDIKTWIDRFPNKAASFFTNQIGHNQFVFDSHGVEGLEKYVSLNMLFPNADAIAINGSFGTKTIGYKSIGENGKPQFKKVGENEYGTFQRGVNGLSNSIRWVKDKYNEYNGKERSNDTHLKVQNGTTFTILSKKDVSKMSKEHLEEIKDAKKRSKELNRNRLILNNQSSEIQKKQALLSQTVASFRAANPNASEELKRYFSKLETNYASSSTKFAEKKIAIYKKYLSANNRNADEIMKATEMANREIDSEFKKYRQKVYGQLNELEIAISEGNIKVTKKERTEIFKNIKLLRTNWRGDEMESFNSTKEGNKEENQTTVNDLNNIIDSRIKNPEDRELLKKNIQNFSKLAANKVNAAKRTINDLLQTLPEKDRNNFMKKLDEITVVSQSTNRADIQTEYGGAHRRAGAFIENNSLYFKYATQDEKDIIMGKPDKDGNTRTPNSQFWRDFGGNLSARFDSGTSEVSQEDLEAYHNMKALIKKKIQEQSRLENIHKKAQLIKKNKKENLKITREMISTTNENLKNSEFKKALKQTHKVYRKTGKISKFDFTADQRKLDHKKLLTELNQQLSKGVDIPSRKIQTVDISDINKQNKLLDQALYAEDLSPEETKKMEKELSKRLYDINQNRVAKGLKVLSNNKNPKEKEYLQSLHENITRRKKYRENKINQTSQSDPSIFKQLSSERISYPRLSESPYYKSLSPSKRTEISNNEAQGVKARSIDEKGNVTYAVPNGTGLDSLVIETSRGKIPAKLKNSAFADRLYSDNFRTPQLLDAMDHGNLFRDMKMIEINAKERQSAVTNLDDLINAIYPRRQGKLFNKEIVQGWKNFSKSLSNANNKSGIQLTDVFQYYQDLSDGELDYNVKQMNANALFDIHNQFQDFILGANGAMPDKKLQEIADWKAHKKAKEHESKIFSGSVNQDNKPILTK